VRKRKIHFTFDSLFHTHCIEIQRDLDRERDFEILFVIYIYIYREVFSDLSYIYIYTEILSRSVRKRKIRFTFDSLFHTHCIEIQRDSERERERLICFVIYI
jgi:hypothetical protein